MTDHDQPVSTTLPLAVRPGPPGGAASLAAALSRRGFLRGSALAGGGLLAAGLAACAPAGAPRWTFSPEASGRPAAPAPSPTSGATISPVPSSTNGHAHTPAPSGGGPGDEHDASAEAVVARFPEATAAPLSRATRWASTRASGGTSSWSATTLACGPSTATSSPTPRAARACSAWSTR